MSCPVNRYTGYCGISKRNILEKTIVKITIIISGFKTLHKYPKKLRRYLIFKSLSTNTCSNQLYFANLLALSTICTIRNSPITKYHLNCVQVCHIKFNDLNLSKNIVLVAWLSFCHKLSILFPTKDNL